MLPPLATLQQFETRLPDGLVPEDNARAVATLEDASALVRAEAGVTWVGTDGNLTDVPDVVVAVVIAMARRAFVNPDGLRSESIQDYQAAYSSSSPDIYMTKAERTAVRRAAGKSGLWTLATTRTDVAGDVPSVRPEPWTNAAEELDPFGESWSS